VGRANQAPFGLDLDQAPQKELAEAHGLLDLAKDWFDDLFA
jgi:hypothetical protein